MHSLLFGLLAPKLSNRGALIWLSNIPSITFSPDYQTQTRSTESPCYVKSINLLVCGLWWCIIILLLICLLNAMSSSLSFICYYSYLVQLYGRNGEMMLTDVCHKRKRYSPSENPAKEITVWSVCGADSYQSVYCGLSISHNVDWITYLVPGDVYFPRMLTFRSGPRWRPRPSSRLRPACRWLFKYGFGD